MRVVVLGGAGNFGARIVRALRGDSRLELLIASRRPAVVQGAEDVRTVQLDVGANDFAARLRSLTPQLLIHCVGPFQGQDYRVAEATLAAGAHYVDLADGRRFVTEFASQIHAQAVAAQRVALCGASTLPALSSAVVDQLRKAFVSMEDIDIVIAPGQRAPRGKATLEAVFSYLGRSFQTWRDARWRPAWGWMDLRQVDLTFGRRVAAACDVPDLELFPARYPDVRNVRFHAALEMGQQHLVLWLLAAARRIGLPFPVTRWAVGLGRFAHWFDAAAGDKGGMRVSIAGLRDDGARVRQTWQLTAPALHGPEIPCMPAILLARRLASGDAPEPGAYACMGLLSLADFSAEFDRWSIVTRIDEKPA